TGGLVGSFFVPEEEEDGGPVALALPPVDGVSSSYFDTVTTGQTASAGGFGITTAAFQNTASFMDAAGLEDWSFTTTWSPPDPGHYPELYSIAPVIRADIGAGTAVYGSTANIRNPITRSGGPGTYAFDRSTTAPTLPLSAPGVATGGVGTYAVTTVPTVTSTGGVPYRVFSTPGTLIVTPAPLVVTANDRSKRYGQELGLGGTAFTARGLVAGDSVSQVDLASLGAGRGASVGDSPFAITASNATGPGLLNPTGVSNYTISYAPGALTVTPAPLVITADDGTKRYGRELGFSGTEFTARGLLNGDSVSRVDLASRGASRGANVGDGPFAITASNARGSGVSNYTVSYAPGALSVTPAPLVVRADDQVKLFGRTFTFDGTEFTTRGLADGDKVLSALLESIGAPDTARVSRDPYRIDISDAVGTGLSFDGVANYDISYAPGEMLVVPFDPSVLPTFNAGLRLAYYTQLPNPDDVIEIAATEGFASGAGGGPTLGPVRGTGITLARESAQDALTFVESISDSLERRVAECNPVPPDTDAFLACVSDALSEYASAIDGRILDLPEPLRRVSAVIRDSAREIEGVRADAARRLALATTDAEREAIARDAAARAGAAMQTAVEEIRSAIQLIRAEDDPQLASLETRQGEAITAALQNVGDELTRAVGL
ncbi:MAG TPA: MBG domain-containing protein, partial [Amaricoccus sp.]|nr:MBG domain-containing protein [Amaricoccus sp.]